MTNSLESITYRIQEEPWPTQGTLRLLPEVEPSFVASLRELPHGDYAIYGDWRSGTISYQSLDGLDQGLLVTGLDPNKVGPIPGRRAAGLGVGLVLDSYGMSRTRYVLDLNAKEIWRLGPLCSEVSRFSPEGGWLISTCGELANPQDVGYVLYEAISAREGAGWLVRIPSKAWTDFEWLDEQTLMISRVEVNLSHIVCGYMLGKDTMICRPEFADAKVVSISPDGKLLVLLGDRNGAARKTAYMASTDCLLEGVPFEITELAEGIPGTWSPDSSRIVDIVSDGEDTRFYVREAPMWEARTEVSSYAGIRQFVDWCPSSHCFLVSDDSDRVQLVYLGGSTADLPSGLVIGAVRVP